MYINLSLSLTKADLSKVMFAKQNVQFAINCHVAFVQKPFFFF